MIRAFCYICPMKNKLLFFLLFLLALNKSSYSQSPAINDAQLWENIYVEKNINKRFIARINEEGRITNNITSPSFIYADMGVNFKLNKHFHFELAYVLTEKQRTSETWSTRHQAYLSMTIRKKFTNIMLDDRNMFQWQVQDIYSSPTGRYAQYYIRNKFSIKYEKYFKLQPYLAEETYYFINQPYTYWQYNFNRIRYFVGCFYNVNLANQWELYYMLENNFNQTNPYSNTPTPNPQNNWVIGVGYSHTF